MTHYELLGLRPEGTDAEVREAIVAARASWLRRRDASAAPAAVERANAALVRLDEAERDLGTPDLRRRYDESALPSDVLHRVRALRAYPSPAREARGSQVAPDGEGAPVGPDTREAADAEQERIATEQAIRAEAERRREARRQDEERAAHERTAWAASDGATGSGSLGGSVTSGGTAAEGTAAAAAKARLDRRPGRKRHKPRLRAFGADIDWRTVSILAAATAAGVGIALLPVALLTSGRPGPALLSDAATASETPKALPVTGVSATISQPPAAPGAGLGTGSSGAATAALLAASDDDPVPPSYAASAGLAAQAAQAGKLPSAAQPGAASQPVAAVMPPATTSVLPAPPAPAVPPESPHSVLRRAYAAYSGGRYEESLRLYDQVLAHKPDDPIARVARALTMLALSRPHDAEVECRIAIKVQPTFPEAHFNLGIALHRQHRDEEAVAAFRRFVELAPDDKAAPQARGFIARWTMAMQAASASRRSGRSGRN